MSSTFFGVSGEENLDLLESLRTSRIKLVLTRHEQGAGFMAATYGRLTGKPGVYLATPGPGATSSLSYTPNGSTNDRFQPRGLSAIHRVSDTPDCCDWSPAQPHCLV